MSDIIDISLHISEDMTTWPGDRDVQISKVRDMDKGDYLSVTNMSLCVHTGTHMDAPNHFIKDGGGIETLSLDTLVGPAQVIELGDVDIIEVKDLEGAGIKNDTTRLLLKTRNSALWDDPAHDFDEAFVAPSPAAAQWLVDQGIQLVGIDYLSIERYKEPGHLTHLILLGAEVAVIEGLDLRAVSAGEYQLTCLPIKIKGSDGSPARAILQPL